MQQTMVHELILQAGSCCIEVNSQTTWQPYAGKQLSLCADLIACLQCLPVQVKVTCQARVPSSSGRQGEGAPFFSSPAQQPLQFTIGSNAVPPGLEAAVCSLSKGEHAIVSCPADQLRAQDTAQLQISVPAALDRVELELHLQHLLEVCHAISSHLSFLVLLDVSPAALLLCSVLQPKRGAESCLRLFVEVCMPARHAIWPLYAC